MDLSELAPQHLLCQGGFLLKADNPDLAEAGVRNWLNEQGLVEGVLTQQIRSPSGSHILCQLEPCYRIQYLPLHDTLNLSQRWQKYRGQSLKLEQEIVLGLLAAPGVLKLGDVASLQSHVRVRAHMARAAQQTALAFKTQAAERPEAFWLYDEEHGFLLRPGCDLIDGLIAATQPEATGRLYDFSCYRASEYVILLGIAQEAQAHHPALYAQLQHTCQLHAIRSGQFHEVFLTEYGTLQTPLPAHYCVPGDRLWFRNPDAHSSDIEGYEGSWVIYMGGGLFSNFWERNRPFTLEAKCLEIFHWRDGVQQDANGHLFMDEVRVTQAVNATRSNSATLQIALDRMMHLRDAQGVYAEGGCIDATREFPKNISRHDCQVNLPRFTP